MVERLSKTQIGNLIVRAVKAAGDGGKVVHEAAVQCALHARNSGDVSLMQRLRDELLKDGAAVNVQGLLFWFGQACPVIERNGTFKLIETKAGSPTYAAYIKRMSRVAKPDKELGPGGRFFFVDYCADKPYWDMDEVRKVQAQPIRPISLKQLVGFAYGIENRYKTALDEGKFAGDREPAEQFLALIRKATADFEKSHTAELMTSEREAAVLKDALERAQDQDLDAASPLKAKAKATKAKAKATKAKAKATADVGGDVAAGVRGEGEQVAAA